MWKYLNKEISTPVAIIIVLILAVIIGGFTWWQYGEIRKEETKLTKIELPEKEETIINFEECVNKGYRVNSDIYYPHSLCETPDGDVFIEGIENNRIFVKKFDNKVVEVKVGEEKLEIDEIIPNLVIDQQIPYEIKNELESKTKIVNKECSINKTFMIDLDDDIETKEYVVEFYCGGGGEDIYIYKKIEDEWKVILEGFGWIEIEKSKTDGMHNLLVSSSIGAGTGIESRYKWNFLLAKYERDQIWDTFLFR